MANDELPEKKIAPSPVVPEAPPAPQPKVFTPLTIFLIILIILSLGVIFFFNSINTLLVETTSKKELAMQTKQQPTPTPTPTPIVLKPDEGTKGNYSISQDATNTGPTISKITFDPLDVQKGQTLTVIATLSSSNPVTSVTAILTTDSKTYPFSLQKTSGSDASSVFTGTVTVQDTLWYKYILELTGVNANGTTKVTVAPRS